MSFTPQYIGSDFAGLVNNVKPLLLFDGAFQQLYNAYAWRNRVKKREGLQLLGRLRRLFVAQATGGVVIGIGATVFNLKTQLGITETNAEIAPGNLSTITISFGAPLGQVWTDTTGTGIMTGFVAPITSVSINYITGDVTVQSAGAFGASIPTITLGYYPSLPVMGILPLDQPGQYNQITIFFDTVYAYQFVGAGFQELASTTPTVWSGTDNDFFSYANWRGTLASATIFYVTNFVNNSANPIRYYNGSTWTDFIPVLADAPATKTYLTQARFLIPYYGRLLALNVWETPDLAGNPDYTASKNIFNRCRFSQIGDPLQPDAWRSDIFGKGGFIDAPVNESIINATFYKNTLIVFFQRSTWLLRYVGEYGLPFLWERISADFGSQSTFSPVLFDEGVIAIADRAIVSSSGNDVQRIDLQIPDLVFDFKDADNAHRRIQGVRDYQKELVYWCYPDGSLNKKFPNYTLLYNYRNQSYAIFRNNITAFGKFNSPNGITWDSLDTLWDSYTVTWDTFLQTDYLDIVCGNQQGYIHYFGEPNSSTTSISTLTTNDEESLSITAIDRSVSPIIITVKNHNLLDGEVIMITGMIFIDTATGLPVSTTLNNKFYNVLFVNDDQVSLAVWDFTTQSPVDNFSYTPANGTGTYMGGGQLALYPVMEIITKDFNPFSAQGLQAKFGHLDLLCDATPNASVSVNLYRQSSLSTKANLKIGQQSTTTALTPNGNIVGITNANPAQVTTRTPHGLPNGARVQLDEITGMISGSDNLNGRTFIITIVDFLNFTINFDTSTYSAYIGEGIWIQTNYPYYEVGSNYAWHRFYAGTYGSFFSLNITYDNNLMNTIATHQEDFVLNAFRIWTKKAGAGVY